MKELEKNQTVNFKRAATEFLLDLLKYRKDNDKQREGEFLEYFMGMLNDNLNQIKTNDVFIEKEAILYVI